MNDSNSIHFVTGKLAEPALREVVRTLAASEGFRYTIDVLPITVAALMTPKWLLRHIAVPLGTTRVLLPGYLAGGLEEIRSALDPSLVIECGPKDVRDLPLLFGKRKHRGDDYGEYSIEIIAEINHAPTLERKTILDQSMQLIAHGANRIDLGCSPGVRWLEVSDTVRMLCDHGIACSIDTFDIWEAERACKAGATLVLSVNKSNRHAAMDWNAEVVVVPDFEDDWMKSLSCSVEYLSSRGVPLRIDPILEPIGCGFAKSLARSIETREAFPEAPMMMGIGNVTELTDCDSASVNTILLGFCEELRIHSVLTTQVISWARTSVRECDFARRLVHYAVAHKTPPKHLEDRLVMLRDPRANSYSREAIELLAARIKDNNYRILIDSEEIHLISAGVHIRGTDPYTMMQQLMELPQSRNVDPSHAFYLGFELSKALTALTVGKRYEQDEALSWGFLTRSESHQRLQRKPRFDQS